MRTSLYTVELLYSNLRLSVFYSGVSNILLYLYIIHLNSVIFYNIAATNERAVRTSTRASHVNYAEESTTTESTSSKSSDSEEAANVKAEVTGESSSVKNIKKTVKEETTVDQVVPS